MRNNGRSGFTLLEALVSLCIMTGTVSAVMIHFASSRRAMKHSIELTQAINEAETLVHRVGIDLPLQEGSWSGYTETGFIWDITILPYKSNGYIIPYLLEVQTRVVKSSIPDVKLITLRRIR